MKINFLGSSHGYAEKNQFISSTMIETGGKYYFIDAGAPIDALTVNLGINYQDIAGIFITHMHVDHVVNLPAITWAFAGYRKNNNCTCVLPDKLAVDGYFAWMKALNTNTEALKEIVSFKEAGEGLCYEDERIKVTSMPTRHLSHTASKSNAYLIEAEGKSILFTGDMLRGFEEYTEMTADRHFNLVVCEMAHMPLSEGVHVIKKTNTDRMIINHTRSLMLEGYDEIIKTIPFKVDVAYDGMIVYL